MRKYLACLIIFLLAACSEKSWIDRLASAEEQRMAIQTAQDVRAGAVDLLAKRIEPELRGELQRGVSEVRPTLERAQGPFEIETVNVMQMYGGPVTKTFVLQTGSGSNWAVIEVVLRGAPGSMRVAGFHAIPLNADPSKLNDFSLSNAGMLGYIWIISMIASVALCLVAVMLIWRGRWLKRRWLWTLGSLLGFSAFGMNWSTGAWSVQVFHVSLLGAGATKAGPLAPWQLTFGIPVIAIIVIVRWLQGRRSREDLAEA